MKRIAALALLFAVIFMAADALRAHSQSFIAKQLFTGQESSTWLTQGNNWAISNALIYAFVFLLAGAGLALFIRGLKNAAVLSFALGLAAPISTLPFEAPRPFMLSTHSPQWLEMLFWANWYLPPLCSLIGGLAVHALFTNKSRLPSAA